MDKACHKAQRLDFGEWKYSILGPRVSTLLLNHRPSVTPHASCSYAPPCKGNHGSCLFRIADGEQGLTRVRGFLSLMSIDDQIFVMSDRFSRAETQTPDSDDEGSCTTASSTSLPLSEANGHERNGEALRPPPAMLCLCVSVRVHGTAHMWRSEDESALAFHRVGPGNQTHVRLGNRYLCLQIHLPLFPFPPFFLSILSV